MQFTGPTNLFALKGPWNTSLTTTWPVAYVLASWLVKQILTFIHAVHFSVKYRRSKRQDESVYTVLWAWNNSGSCKAYSKLLKLFSFFCTRFQFLMHVFRQQIVARHKHWWPRFLSQKWTRIQAISPRCFAQEVFLLSICYFTFYLSTLYVQSRHPLQCMHRIGDDE